MKQFKELVGYVAAVLMLCIWLVTILIYGKKIDANTEALKGIDEELKSVHETVISQSNWNTRVGTIIELQTGIQVNP